MDNILQNIIDGNRMTNDEFVKLYNNADLIKLGQAANKVRLNKFGNDLATFVIDRNINYTNICLCKCKFCAFYREKDDDDAYILDEKTLLDKVEEAISLGATQLMIQGGLNKDLDITYFEQMFRLIKSKYDITIHSLSAPEIVHIAKMSNLTIEETLHRLKIAGLDSLPGGGAEILHDEVRKQISPKKIKTKEWLNVMQAAHNAGIYSTATMMMGSVESLEHRLSHLDVIRKLQDETGKFRAFIMWTYQATLNTIAGKHVSAVEYLKFLALSRLYLDNFSHIQGSLVTQGEHIGQLSLFFGADDLGSVMLEENVVKAAGVDNKINESAMLKLIKTTGRTPALRDTEYNILKIFD
ncbi:MAG: dehypoxanthine futalosine cyclase [Syntrophomonadaceae bacterium]|nr:dehypoxanthine futalosine cyclase [Syntrophomonadaceae bacterium]